MRFLSKDSIKSSLLMLLVTFFWGSAVVAQDEGMRYMGPLSFTAVRCLLAAAVLFALYFAGKGVRRLRKLPPVPRDEDRAKVKASIVGGCICGSFLVVGLLLQQYGLLYTTVGKSAFIATLYVVFIPLVELLFGHRPKLRLWLSVALSVLGLYFMCMTGSFSFGAGDLLTLGSAFIIGLYIIGLDRYVQRVDAFLFTAFQQLVCGTVSLIAMFLFEGTTWNAIMNSWLPILYAGVVSGVFAYALEVYAQRGLSPVLAAIFFTTEAIFAALASYVVQGELFTPREAIGALLVFAAVVAARLPEWKKKPKTEQQK